MEGRNLHQLIHAHATVAIHIEGLDHVQGQRSVFASMAQQGAHLNSRGRGRGRGRSRGRDRGRSKVEGKLGVGVGARVRACNTATQSNPKNS